MPTRRSRASTGSRCASFRPTARSGAPPAPSRRWSKPRSTEPAAKIRYRPDARCQFVYIDDVVTALMAALSVERHTQRIYNVTGGTSLTLAEVATIARKVLPGLSVEFGDDPLSREYCLRRDRHIGGRTRSRLRPESRPCRRDRGLRGAPSGRVVRIYCAAMRVCSPRSQMFITSSDDSMSKREPMTLSDASCRSLL